MAGAISGSEMTGRIIAMLDALVRGSSRPDRAWGVRQLAAELNASRSTVNRVLQGLSEDGFAKVTPDGSYSAGPRLRVLASIVQRCHPVFHRARPIVEKLAEDTDATVVLALHAQPALEAFIAIVHQRPGPVRYSVVPGDSLPLYAGAAGRAILGQLGAEALDKIELAPLTSDTVVETDQLMRLLEADRRRGFAVSVGQLYSAAAGVSAPFRVQDMHAAVSVTRPRQASDDASMQRNGQRVHAAAAELERSCRIDDATPEHGTTFLPPGSSAIQRVCRLVTIVASRPHGVRIDKTLPRWIGATTATTTALVARAEELGLVDVAEEVVQPGALILRWAAALGPSAPTAQVTDTLLRQLGQQTGETIGLAEYSQDTHAARMTAVVPGARPMDYSLAADVDIPLYAGAAGKAILAFCGDDTFDRLELRSLTDKTVTDRAELANQLALVRERGYATGEGERIPDAFGVSAPYFNDGTIAGSVTVTVPNTRIHSIDIEALGNEVMTTSARISDLISP